jgi:hypothetical protein
VLQRIARLAIAAPKRMLVAAAMFAVVAAVFGVPVPKVLSAGGFDDPSSESSQADGLLADGFHQGDMKVLIAVTSGDGAQSDAAQSVPSIRTGNPKPKSAVERKLRHATALAALSADEAASRLELDWSKPLARHAVSMLQGFRSMSRRLVS